MVTRTIARTRERTQFEKLLDTLEDHVLTTADASRFEALMDIPAPLLSRLRHPPRTSTHIDARYAFFLSNAEQVRETHEAFATYVHIRDLLRQDRDTSLDIFPDRNFAKTFTTAPLAASIRKLRLGCVNPAHEKRPKTRKNQKKRSGAVWL